MSDWIELAWFLAVFMLGLWVREVGKRLTVLQDTTIKALDAIADRINREHAATQASFDSVMSTDMFRNLKKATEDEDFVNAAILRLRSEGHFDSAQKLEEMEHQVRCGNDAHVFKNFFRGIGWVPE